MIGTDIDIAANLLTNGQVVAIPTETVYGLAANAFNANAVAKIYAIKNRPAFNPLIIHAHHPKQLADWGLQVPTKMEMLLSHFSPGPLTYVIPKSNAIPDLVTAGTNAVAVRFPNHAITLKLLQQLEFPLAAPSANPSGFVSPTTAQHVNQQLGQQIPYILDGGNCSVGVESTIISFLNPVPEILRYGGVTIEEIETVIGKVLDKPKLSGTQITTDNPVAPGQLAKHYATKHPLIIGNINTITLPKNLNKVACISFNAYNHLLPIENQFVLSGNNNLAEAAQKLFSVLRQLNEMDLDLIIAEQFPDIGIGKAINDRLYRASIKN